MTNTHLPTDAEDRPKTPLDLSRYYIFGRFPILVFTGTLGALGLIVTALYEYFKIA